MALQQFVLYVLVMTGVHVDQPSYDSHVGESGRTVSIVRKERDFRGMLEYRREDESKLLKILITGHLNIKNTQKTFITQTALLFCVCITVLRSVF